MKQTVLVTGASSGIGRLLATRLHEGGYHVIGTSRDPEKHRSRVPYELLPLDVTNDASIGAFGKLLFGRIQRLDVLINNAGDLITGLAEETSVKLGRQQLETNFWGAVKLTNELLPYLRKQRHGRIVTLGSMLGMVGLPGVAYYAASKHALEGYFKSLRFELAQFNIKVSMVEPMSFKTSIGANAVAANTTIGDYDLFRKKVDAYRQDTFDKAPDPEPVLRTVLRILQQKDPVFSHPVGKGTGLILTLQKFAYRVLEKNVLKQVESAA